MGSELAEAWMPQGASVQPGGGVRFRVWAPKRTRVEVVLVGGPGGGTARPLGREGDGYFAGMVAEAGPGTLYRYRLDGSGEFPDPASRFQPEGPTGPSEVIDPAGYRWGDGAWRGIGPRGQVLYEMHVGAFTPEGTWAAAAAQLPALAELGITAVQILPVGDYGGAFNWGYDGVDLYALCRHYGRPDDFRRFVDRAHATGLGVVLDVVYNHFGVVGNYFREFAEAYFSGRMTEWGDALNFDGPNCGPVRDFVLANVAYWFREFHIDGLRIDASQQIFDSSEDHILAAIARVARVAAGGRQTFITAENEPNWSHLARPVEQGGRGLDALWNEDFHHVAVINLTGRREAYYGDYHGSPQEFVSVARRGFLYQGQLNPRQGKRRGEPTTGLHPEAFIHYLENHDQVANTLRGDRLHQVASPAQYRAVTAAWLLIPGTPIFFMGQEYGSTKPFLYFNDCGPDLADEVYQGRCDFLSQFASIGCPEALELLARPCDPQTFERSKLDPAERARNAKVVEFHRDLLRLRREDPVLSARRPGGVDGAVLGPHAFVLRYFDPDGDGDDRLLVVNLGAEQPFDPAPEPLLAPPLGRRWRTSWSSEDPNYGGLGIPRLIGDTCNWHLPAHVAVVLTPEPSEE